MGSFVTRVSPAGDVINQSSVITALIYPAFLFVAGMLVSGLFVTFLVPQLASLLKSSNKPLPLPAPRRSVIAACGLPVMF